MDSVVPLCATHHLISRKDAGRLSQTQFRSFELLPRIAWLISRGIAVSGEPYPIPTDALAPAVWWVDSFGNAKTTALPEDAEFKPKKSSRQKSVPLYATRISQMSRTDQLQLLGEALGSESNGCLRS